MDFNTIVVTIGKNPELTAQAGNILGLVMVENTKLLLDKELFEKENVKEQLEGFRINLEVAGIIQPKSELTLTDLYEKIVRPVRMNLVK